LEIGHTNISAALADKPDNESGPRQALADRVAAQVEALIMEGVLKAGQALPSERRLTEKLGVSRTALREGLKLLRARGIITTAQGRGSHVSQLSQVDAAPLVHLYHSQPRTLYDLLEVRALLEAESARLAAIRGTDADRIMIRRRYDAMTAAAPDAEVATHAHLDHAFHLAICEASHNPVLTHTLQALNDLMLGSVFACVNNLYHRDPHKRNIDRQHARLFKAVMACQPRQAHNAALAHVDSVRRSLGEIEQEEARLVRATRRLEGWA